MKIPNNNEETRNRENDERLSPKIKSNDKIREVNSENKPSNRMVIPS